MAEKLAQEDIIEAVENMSVLELAELVEALEERFGVSAAAPVAVGAAGAPAAEAEAAAEEEKTEFNVVLTEIGPQKIQVIKAVRELTDLGLREAKEVVEGAPNPIIQGVDKEQAEGAKERLEEAGGDVEIQ